MRVNRRSRDFMVMVRVRVGCRLLRNGGLWESLGLGLGLDLPVRIAASVVASSPSTLLVAPSSTLRFRKLFSSSRVTALTLGFGLGLDFQFVWVGLGLGLG